MKKMLAILLAVLVMVGCLAACDTKTDNPGTTPATPGTSGSDPVVSAEKEHPILKVRANSDISCLDPGYTVVPNEFITFMNIFDGLVEFDHEDLQTVRADLAESWTVSDDGTEYTFKIRDGVFFHNGDPLTIDDVVFSYERILVSPATAGKASAIDHVERISDNEIKIVLKYNYPNFLSQLASYPYRIVSKSVVEANGDDNLNMVIGTGAYSLDRLVPGEGVYLKAHEGHHQGAPYFDEVHIMIIPDENTAMTALLNGEIDINQIPTYLDLQMVQGNDDFSVTELRRCQAYVLGLNTTRAPLDDIAVRQAISYAIDKQQYIDLVWDGQAYDDCNSLISPDEPGWSADLPTYDYNVEKARQLLSDAGYKDGDITVELIVRTTGFGPNFAAAFQQSMEAIGINVKIDARDVGGVTNAMLGGDFQIILAEGNATIPYNAPLTSNLYYKTGGSINMSQHSDEDINALIAEANAEPDEAKRTELYNQMHMLVNERAYYVPIAYVKTNFGAPKELEGMCWEPGTLVTHYKYYSWDSSK